MSWNAVKKIPAVLLAIPLAASMFLTGCDGAGKPEAKSSSTSSPAPRPTSGPTTAASPSVATPTTDPNIPTAARAHTTAGAEAFVKYFFEQLNVAWTVPQAGILSPLCQSSAVACATFEKTAVRLAKEGHRYDGSPVTVAFIGTTDAARADRYDVLANVVQERRSEIDGDGKALVTDRRKKLRFHFVLLFSGQNWSVSSLNLMK